MKCGARVALGVAGGYFLGRTKKMKLALMLGGMAAGRQAGGPGQLLAQGSRLLGQSPELSRLADEVRGRLLEAGKGAAISIAARQVESLTDRVGKRVESLGDLGASAARTTRRSAKPEPEPEPESDDYDEPDASDTPTDDEADRSDKRSTPTGTVRRATSSAGDASGRAATKATSTRAKNGRTSSSRSAARSPSARSGSSRSGSARSGRTRRSDDDG